MPYTNLPLDGTSDKLSIKVPTKGTTNWDETLKNDTFEKIATHTHDGNGLGAKISVKDLKEQGSLSLTDTSGSFVDGLASSVFQLTAGTGAQIEYSVKDASNNIQTGTLTIHKNASSDSLADEFVGDDLSVDFQLKADGTLQYKNTSSTKTFHYFIKKIGV